MSEIYFTSDTHIGHKLVAELRGFSSTEEHDAELARRWDETVGPQDTVWHLGDLCIGYGTPQRNALRWAASRRGRYKHFIWGNHDSGHPSHAGSKTRKAASAFRSVFTSVQERATLKIADQRVILSHFPYTADHTPEARYQEWRVQDTGRWLLHGHVHKPWKQNGRQIHVGLDAWELRPVHISEIEARIWDLAEGDG